MTKASEIRELFKARFEGTAALNQLLDLDDEQTIRVAAGMKRGIWFGTAVFDGARETEIKALLKAAGLPDLVHVHPEETVGSAIATLREYGVSQMPVVKEEPPLMAAEVIGSVVERELLQATFADRAVLDSPLGGWMSPPLPVVGAGEPVARSGS